mmetsp:Transcript_132914/g.230979  ORF Transcript_132914/g.230979 Transcript_132914/m.230979 type:complete len:214 (+) Transcript_132914:112-753(+)
MPRSIAEAITMEPNLARPHLERLDLFGELGKYRHGEAKRHKSSLHSKRPSTPKRSGGVFPVKIDKPKPASRRPIAAPEPAPEADPKNDMPATMRYASRTFLNNINDPSCYPNRHVERSRELGKAIALQERALRMARSESALGRMWEFESPTRFDHVPVAFELTEQKLAFYPRSLSSVRDCGGGKDPKIMRPYDDVYRFREAMCRNKGMLSKEP